MTTTTIDQVEQALLDCAKAQLLNRVRTFATLPGDWDDEMLHRIAKALPGVFVAFLGGERSNAAGANYPRIDSRWAVYVCTGHPTDEARRVGNAVAIGAYQMLMALLPALGTLAVPGYGTLDLVSVQNLFTGQVEKQAVTIYAMVFGLPMEFEPVPNEALLGNFETFDVQYDIPPLTPAEHAKWLAADYSTSTPDAHDTVALPQP